VREFLKFIASHRSSREYTKREKRNFELIFDRVLFIASVDVIGGVTLSALFPLYRRALELSKTESFIAF
jgi:hypothetical protein